MGGGGGEISVCTGVGQRAGGGNRDVGELGSRCGGGGGGGSRMTPHFLGIFFIHFLYKVLGKRSVQKEHFRKYITLSIGISGRTDMPPPPPHTHTPAFF